MLNTLKQLRVVILSLKSELQERFQCNHKNIIVNLLKLYKTVESEMQCHNTM